ncbi:hypothetical protein Tco_0626474 [Tanacetum coccineum]|uniref:Uncharacterized protein n=1 Tax=Tanacetum coccineum TaxID=301880 RepID=A0ABQ4WJR8_9ASTR
MFTQISKNKRRMPWVMVDSTITRITNLEWKEIPFNFNLTDIKQQGVGSESLDGGITEFMGGGNNLESRKLYTLQESPKFKRRKEDGFLHDIRTITSTTRNPTSEIDGGFYRGRWIQEDLRPTQQHL